MNQSSATFVHLGLAFLLSCPALAANSNLTVAADGSGKFKTIQEAIAAAPSGSSDRTTILISTGTYQGNFIVPKDKTNLTLKGQDPKTTVLTWDRSVYDPKPGGAAQFNPCLWVQGDGFQAEGLTIENAAGDRGQALAADIGSDNVMLKNCRITGWQDTLFINNGPQYYENCYIEGRVDFIYGGATAVFKNCEIHSKNGGLVTAASTSQGQRYGFVFIDCNLTGSPDPWVDPKTGQAKSSPGALALLGRPWRAYANVAYINCTMGDHIRPEGWSDWGNADNQKTAQYLEFGSKTPSGSPVDVSKRVPWSKQLSADEAAKYTVSNILIGDWGTWDPTTPEGKPANVTALLARDAKIDGANAKLENGGGSIGYWTNPDTSVKWMPNLKSGTYRVGLSYSLGVPNPTTQIQVKVGDKTFPVSPASTDGWDQYTTISVGDVKIDQGGSTPVEVDALSTTGKFVLNLKQVILKKQ
jgi:pectinesterase